MSAYSNILTYLLLGHPRTTVDFTGKTQLYVYRGPTATLAANTPTFNDDWNGQPVLSVTGPYQLGKSAISELMVTSKTPDFSAVSAAGIAAIASPEFPLYEVEEAGIERPLREHPYFSTMSDADWQAIEDWTNERKSDLRNIFQYYKKNENGDPDGSPVALSTTASPTGSAQDFAKLLLQGYETYPDFEPVARRTDLLYGEDLVSVGQIGTKIVGDPFTGVPSGYEWVLVADRRRKQGRGFHWTRERLWKGSLKVKIDSTAIY